jgi:cell division septation protein DedD
VPDKEDGKPKPPSHAGAASSSRAADRPASAAKDCPPCQTSGKYAVLVSSNRQPAAAQNDLKRLQDKGHQASIAISKTRSGTWHMVWAGCCTSESQARQLADRLVRQGFPRDLKVSVP